MEKGTKNSSAVIFKTDESNELADNEEYFFNIYNWTEKYREREKSRSCNINLALKTLKLSEILTLRDMNDNMLRMTKQ